MRKVLDMKDSGFKDKVFRAVAMIPEGRVGTYAQVAELAGFPGAARAVGNALHLNTDPIKVPCHRIVCSNGCLGSGYAFGGHTDISVFGRDIRWWRMPSTSRAYPMKLEEKTLHYRKALTPFGK